MNVNLTFFLQIINFLFAYVFIERFFFKPFVKKINEEDEEVSEQMSATNAQKQDLEMLKLHAEEQRHIYQRSLQMVVPKLEGTRAACFVSQVKISEKIDKKTEENLINSLKKQIKDKIFYA